MQEAFQRWSSYGVWKTGRVWTLDGYGVYQF